ncbi:MAG: hypothetical protein ACFFC6_17885, partial [Promethearchaeota archaeon]
MDFNSAIKNVQFYLDNQSFLQNVSSLEDLEHIPTPVFCLLLTQKGEVLYLPEDRLFKKGIFFFDDDWIDPTKLKEHRQTTKDRLLKNTFSKSNIIKSSSDLFDNLINEKLIKSGYRDLFNNCKEINYSD